MKKEKVEQYIKENKGTALKRASEILEKETSMASFNGIIGSKNGTYAIDPLDYEDSEKYIEDWNLKHEECYAVEKNFPYEKASHRVHKLLKDEFLQEYINNYLARIYYNKHEK
ncbi:hypothetical protein [Clostridium sp.]|uniref:hypothetical protein n=1 Tax=Clostridium sp. TaxID=1506 RepID=UPI003D6D7945